MLPLNKDTTFVVNGRGELKVSGGCNSSWTAIKETYEAVKLFEVQKRTGLPASVIKQLAAQGELPVIRAGNATRYVVPKIDCAKCNPIEPWDITKCLRFSPDLSRQIDFPHE
jgi:hypothetical protein